MTVNRGWIHLLSSVKTGREKKRGKGSEGSPIGERPGKDRENEREKKKDT